MRNLPLAASVLICVVLYLLVRFGAENLQHWLLPGGDLTARVVLLGSAAAYFQGSQPMLMASLFIAQCFAAGLVVAAAGGAARLVRFTRSCRQASLRDVA